MKYYNISVNGVAYSVSVEETLPALHPCSCCRTRTQGRSGSRCRCCSCRTRCSCFRRRC